MRLASKYMRQIHPRARERFVEVMLNRSGINAFDFHRSVSLECCISQQCQQKWTLITSNDPTVLPRYDLDQTFLRAETIKACFQRCCEDCTC